MTYVILTVAAVSALSQLGINTSCLLASLGVTGFTIGHSRGRVLGHLHDAHPMSQAEPVPRAVMAPFSDYEVEVASQPWIDDEQQHVSSRFELRRPACEAQRTARNVMPYETIKVAALTLRMAS